MSGRVLLLLCALGVLSAPVALLAVVCWRGVWRWLAAAPLALSAAYIVKIGVDFALDPTSHNLLPLELALWWSLAAPYLVVLFLLRLVLRRRGEPRAAA